MTQRKAKPLRSQATRDRILLEAQRLFSREGFEKTTIRAVAAAANINPSMVMRYYRSKDELFAAAAQIDFRMPDLSAEEESKRGVALITHILNAWEGPQARGQLHILLRAAGTHEAARRRLVRVVEEQALPAIRAVLPNDRNAETEIGLILIQLAGLVLSRYFLRYNAVLELDRSTLIVEVGASVQKYLTRPPKAPVRKRLP